MSSASYAMGLPSLCSSGTIRGELANRALNDRANNLAFGGSNEDPDHDAAMRIGGEAPGWRVQS